MVPLCSILTVQARNALIHKLGVHGQGRGEDSLVTGQYERLFARHNKNTIGDEDNGKPPHKIHFPEKLRALSLVSAMPKSSMRRNFLHT